MLSLRQIRYFMTVARTGSITAAARELNVSQPALGQQVKLLEQELGCTLFRRHARGISLTEAGEAILPHASDSLASLDRAQAAVARFASREYVTIMIGMTPTPGKALVADLLKTCADAAPHLTLVLREDLTDDLWQSVTEGKLDAAICYDPPDEPRVRIVPLYREDMYLVGTAAAVGDDNGEIDRADIGDLPLVLGYPTHRTRQVIEAAFREARRDFRSVTEIEPAILKREMLVREGRCAIVPYGLFRDDIASGLFRARHIVPPISRTAAMVLSRRAPPQAEDGLLPIIKGLIKRHIGEGKLRWRVP